jgi:hypothetical protein
MRLILAAFLCLSLARYAVAEPTASWRDADAAAIAWANPVSREVQANCHSQRPTAVMVVQDDRVIARYGDVGRRVNVHSARKSLLSALYGICYLGRVDQSLQHAGAARHRRQAARPHEGRKAGDRARSADGRSGIYHPAAHETSDIRQNRPTRGSHAAGTFWFYNNWDFNALGTIYRQATGEDIFQSFAQRIARPIDMEDFSSA